MHKCYCTVFQKIAIVKILSPQSLTWAPGVYITHTQLLPFDWWTRIRLRSTKGETNLGTGAGLNTFKSETCY